MKRVATKPVALVTQEALRSSLLRQLAETRQNAEELRDSLNDYTGIHPDKATVAKEIARLLGVVRHLELMRDQYMTQCAEMKRTIAVKDRRLGKLLAAPTAQACA